MECRIHRLLQPPRHRQQSLKPVLIRNLVYTNAMTCDQDHPVLLAVLEQNTSPEQAIQLIEQS